LPCVAWVLQRDKVTEEDELLAIRYQLFAFCKEALIIACIINQEKSMLQVAPNIYQLHIPLPEKRLSILNAYVIKTGEGAMLIDTGWNTNEAYDSLIAQLGQIGLSPADLKYIVVTHFHPDHFGLTERLSQVSNAILIQHKIEVDLLTQRRVDAEKALSSMAKWLNRNGFPETGFEEIKDITLSVYKLNGNAAKLLSVSGGEKIHLGPFDFEIVWAPGHSPGMICLFEPNLEILFCSDHVLAHTTPNISLFSELAGNPLGDYFQSLQKVSRLKVQTAYPAHGKIITNLPERVEQMINHHEERLEEMLVVCHAQPSNAYDIASNVSWSMNWDSMPMFHRRFALLETLAHLEFLLRRGQLIKSETPDGITYRLAS
jgi:glyoxylase-like metal-dependent hydrolase (beta-lactamase superfamily II)